jgi:hypothetical protein
VTSSHLGDYPELYLAELDQTTRGRVVSGADASAVRAMVADSQRESILKNLINWQPKQLREPKDVNRIDESQSEKLAFYH